MSMKMNVVGYSGINISTDELQPNESVHDSSRRDLKEIKEDTLKNTRAKFYERLNRLLANAHEDQKLIAGPQLYEFSRLFQRYQENRSINWNSIQNLPENAIKDYDTLSNPNHHEIANMLRELVVVKLNGGLGTSMGCHGPKSIIQVRNGLSFLDLTVQQIEHLNKKYNTNVPLVLMNSFYTDTDTAKMINKYKGHKVRIYTFNQSYLPRLNKESLTPIPETFNIKENIEGWYPPGHGDFYESFMSSGLLNKFINNGRGYCFISNIDNLGATVDLNILNILLNRKSQSPEFIMEVTNKTKADVKGGTLIQYKNKLQLLEIAQVPKEHLEEFKSVKKFKYFNTNNLWIKLGPVLDIMNEKAMDLELIVNHKTLDNNLNIIQLESAVGSAMKSFKNSLGINVPRSRFLPVKKTSDLLLVMSNLYNMCDGFLTISPLKMFPTTPLIKLGKNFDDVKSFLSSFATIPDILELDHLTVSGDVHFGSNISLKGTVIIIANDGERIDIPSNSILENKIVTGNLRIQDH